MTTEKERVDQLFWEFANANDALLVKSFDRTFAESVDDYRRLEAEFVARMGDSEFGVLETRRRIAEDILSLAHSKHPPFEVCREVWNELVRLGFSSIETRCWKTWFYADCCAYDEQPDEGLAVLEPLLAEIEQRLEEARATQNPTEFYEYEIEKLGDLRDELLAQQRGQQISERSTRRLDEAYRRTPEDEQIARLHDELSNACLTVFKTFARTQRSFADVAADYRRVEADFVARAGEGEASQTFVRSVRRRIADAILMATCSLEQPFDVCRDAWNERVRVGFRDIGDSCRMAEMYAETCVFNHKPEEGLAVIEPLLAEVERGLDAEIARRSEARAKGEIPTTTKWPPRFYREKIEHLRELRDRLEALRKGVEPAT